jgi:hypothetical protein
MGPIRRAAILLLLAVATTVVAGPPEDSGRAIDDALAANRALVEARDLLTQGDAKQAIEILEAKLPLVGTNQKEFLGTLRDAYWAYLKQLQRERRDEQIPLYLKRLRLLDPQAELEGFPAPEAPSPKPVARAKSPESPPATAEPSPHRQILANLDRAEAAFKQSDFAEAGRWYAQVHAQDAKALGAAAGRWAYCRLYRVHEQLKHGPIDAAKRTELEREVQAAVELAPDKPQLLAFARDVQRQLQDGGTVATGDASTRPLPKQADGWKRVESENFIVLHNGDAAFAEQVARTGERTRQTAFEKWYGTPAAGWSPRCEIYLHANRDAYSKATGKTADAPGHATLRYQGHQIVSRRIDIPLDNANLLSITLPHETTHVVLADLFPDPPLPRWADEAMAVLAEDPAQIARYRDRLPQLRREGKLFAIGQLMTMADFPEPRSITAFFVQSVAITEYLSGLRGPKAFTVYLRDAQRYGYERALERSYGIRSFSELQERWERALPAAARGSSRP